MSVEAFGAAPRVLAAEDNVFNRALIDETLSAMGVDHKVVENGRSAVEAFYGERFDIVLMDLQMPVMDGLDAAMRIRERALREMRRVRLIAVTADGQDGPAASRDDGLFDSVLVKPLRRSDLLSAIGGGIAVTSLRNERGSDDEVFDAEYGLRSAGGVPEQFLVLVNLFLKHTPDLISLLDGSVQLERYGDVAFHAHSLSGSAAAIGALKISSIARRLEGAARAGGDRSEVTAFRGEIDAQWVQLRKFLDKVVSGARGE
ncbi:MAG TPA: response regulator [Bryobacteraceae bacterium]|jgi:CheY-like chemotaxis protein|nr:response regulator [Bryobacteraceae bacterium]